MTTVAPYSTFSSNIVPISTDDHRPYHCTECSNNQYRKCSCRIYHNGREGGGDVVGGSVTDQKMLKCFRIQ